jgi:hypothetical protein
MNALRRVRHINKVHVAERYARHWHVGHRLELRKAVRRNRRKGNSPDPGDTRSIQQVGWKNPGEPREREFACWDRFNSVMGMKIVDPGFDAWKGSEQSVQQFNHFVHPRASGRQPSAKKGGDARASPPSNAGSEDPRLHCRVSEQVPPQHPETKLLRPFVPFDPLIYSTSSLVKASSGSTKYSISRSSSSSSGDGGGGGGGSSAGIRTFR